MQVKSYMYVFVGFSPRSYGVCRDSDMCLDVAQRRYDSAVKGKLQDPVILATCRHTQDHVLLCSREQKSGVNHVHRQFARYTTQGCVQKDLQEVNLAHTVLLYTSIRIT